jgi:MFS family permease
MNKNILVAGILTLFLASFVRSSLNLALPVISAEFNLSGIFITWIPTLYLLVNAVLYVPFGKIVDIYGGKWVFQYGLVIFTLSSFLCAFSVSGEMLLIIRIFQAIGNAMIFVSLYALISCSFKFDNLGKAFGLIIMGFSIGLIMGPILGGFLTQMLGWRSLFITDALIGAFTTLTIFRFKPNWNKSKEKKFDLTGSIVLGVSIILIISGFSNLGWTYRFISLSAGVFGLLIFYLVEKRSACPLVNLDLFKSYGYVFGNVTSMINYSSFIAVNFILSPYLMIVLGLSPLKAGLMLSVSAVVMLVLSPVSGKLSDRFNQNSISTVGMFFNTVGIATMAMLNENINMVLMLLSFTVFGIGNGLFFPSNTKSVISSADKNHLGIASAILSNTRTMGQVFGMGIVLLVITEFVGNVNLALADPATLLMSIKVSLIVLSTLCASGIFTSALMDKNLD